MVGKRCNTCATSLYARFKSRYSCQHYQNGRRFSEAKQIPLTIRREAIVRSSEIHWPSEGTVVVVCTYLSVGLHGKPMTWRFPPRIRISNLDLESSASRYKQRQGPTTYLAGNRPFYTSRILLSMTFLLEQSLWSSGRQRWLSRTQTTSPSRHVSRSVNTACATNPMSSDHHGRFRVC